MKDKFLNDTAAAMALSEGNIPVSTGRNKPIHELVNNLTQRVEKIEDFIAKPDVKMYEVKDREDIDYSDMEVAEGYEILSFTSWRDRTFGYDIMHTGYKCEIIAVLSPGYVLIKTPSPSVPEVSEGTVEVCEVTGAVDDLGSAFSIMDDFLANGNGRTVKEYLKDLEIAEGE